MTVVSTGGLMGRRVYVHPQPGVYRCLYTIARDEATT